MAADDRTRPNPLAILFLAWLPLAVLLPLAASQMAADPLEGLRFGTVSALVGAVLMAAAWWTSSRIASRERSSLQSGLAHVATGVTFAVAWRAIVFLVAGLQDSAGALAAVRTGFASPTVIWDLMLKVVVYSLVVALVYATRQADRARAERLRAARIDALASEARLAALQAQLNPHFLFNTLHSLTVLIRREPATAEEAVDRLGELLRFALRRSAEVDVPFQDELQFVQHYLTLEQLRLEERLRVVTDIDPGTMAVRVPPFCLQPLVENAIRHGLSPREEGGTLWISARLNPNGLFLEVRDNGVGAESNGRLRPGSGLHNLTHRLEARGGGTGSLAIETAPLQGYKVSLRVPVGRSGARSLEPQWAGS